MQAGEEVVLLRIIISEYEYLDRKPLYECIANKAREMGLAGATVLRGRMGFGKSAKARASSGILASQASPAVIEIADEETKIAIFLPVLSSMMRGGFVTTQKINVLQFDRHSESAR